MPTNLNPPTEVFISYAHADERLREKLVKHLASLEHEGVITSWHDRKIVPGEEWDKEIDKHLNTAGVILLLVSADFLASGYSYGFEFKRAMERHKLGQARIIPIILRPSLWQNTPIGNFQVLPEGAKPVVNWNSVDAAFLSVAKGIKRAVREISEPPLHIPFDSDITKITITCKGSPNSFHLDEFKQSLRDNFGVDLELITISVHTGSVKVVIEGDAEELYRIINGLLDPTLREKFAECNDLISIRYTQRNQNEHAIPVTQIDPTSIETKNIKAAVTPHGILNQAIRAVPAIKYALGVAGIGAAVAIVAGFSIDYKVAVLGTLIMFGLMFGLVLFSSFSSNSPASLRPLALTLAWTFVLLIASSSFCIFTGFFFSWPRPLGSYVGIPEPTPTPIQIAITQIPPSGSGSDSQARISGTVSGVRPDDYRVVIYSFTNMWYVQPATNDPKTEINPDGSWSADIHNGTRYAALLVPRDYNPPVTTSSLPTRMAGVVAATEIDGRR